MPPTSKRPRILEDEESDSVSALTTPSSVTPPPISANNVALNNIHNGGNGSSSPEIICLDDDWKNNALFSSLTNYSYINKKDAYGTIHTLLEKTLNFWYYSYRKYENKALELEDKKICVKQKFLL